MGLEQRWQQRWATRSEPAAPTADHTRTFRLYEAAKLRHSAEDVWELVRPAESSLLLSPETTARAFTVPGTGPGVGEQQMTIDHDGQASLIEVIEVDEGRRAVTLLRSPKPPVPVRSVTMVEPLGPGCLLTFGMEFDAPATTVWTAAEQNETRQILVTYLDRVRRALDTA